MRLTLAAALLLCSCSLRDARTTAMPCSSTLQCDRPEVCFQGECRSRSKDLSLVSAEVHPPNDSQFGLLQQANINLQQGVVRDFELQAPFAVSGQVRQEQDDGGVTPVSGAVLTFTDHQPAIPDRVDQVIARSDTAGQFSARLPAANWDLVLQPPAPLPPKRWGSLLNGPAVALDMRLPRPGSLMQVSGTLSAGGQLVTGARVAAVDAAGSPLSAPAMSADGGFSLLLPPGTPSYYLQIGPPTEADGGVPNVDPLPTYDYVTPSPTVTLPLEPAATLSGKVLDAAGAGIAGARVYARSAGVGPGILSRSTAAGSDGSYSLLLRAGTYFVEAAPAGTPDAPSVSSVQTQTISAPGKTLDIRCPAKQRAFGMVRKPDGTSAGSGYQITATRVADELLTTRTAYATTTDAAGIYRLIGDLGTYRVEVQPPVTTYPRKIVQIELIAATSEYPLPDIQISTPVAVVGTVHGKPPGGVDGPIAGASVDFYALDASGRHAVYIGSGLTDAKGQYKAVLPDVPQPATKP
jgi:hypothetical protein